MNIGITASHPINLPLSSTNPTLVRGKGLAALLVALHLKRMSIDTLLVYEGELPLRYTLDISDERLSQLISLIAKHPAKRLRLLAARLAGRRTIEVEDRLSSLLVRRLPLLGIPVARSIVDGCLIPCTVIHVNKCPEPMPEELHALVDSIGEDCISQRYAIRITVDARNIILIGSKRLNELLDAI